MASVLSCSDVPIAPRPGGVIVSGRVTDRDGPALAGVYVSFRSEAVGGSYEDASTDSDGRYSLRVSEGVYRVFLGPPSPGGYPHIVLGGIKVGASGATVDYRYAGVRVSGSVVGPNGGFFTTSQVVAQRSAGGEDIGAAASTVAGHYSLLIPAGLYDFSASAGGYVDGVPRITWSNVAVASDTTMDIALTGFLVTVTTFSSTTPMAGALAAATSSSVQALARTSLGGTATLYLPAGDYTIRVTPSRANIVGPITIARSITADDAVDFDFSGPTWGMTLRRASDGTLLTGATVKLADGGDGYAGAQTDAFGACEFLVRPGVGYTMTVQWYEGNRNVSASIPNLSSVADTTFNLSLTPDPLP